MVPAVAQAQTNDVAPEGESTRVTKEERPFVHLLDPTTPGAGNVSLGYSVGFGSGVSAERPLPASPGTASASHAATMTYGATDHVAPFVGGVADVGYGATALVGARFQLTDVGASFKLGFATTAFREGRGGAFGASVRVTSSYDVGRVRFAGNLHFERAFASGRDAVDVLALAGVSYRVTSSLRLGAEYVGQDLEDAAEHDVEGGAKQYVGPTAAIDVAGGRAQIAFGPAFGLTAQTPRLLGKVSVVVSF